MRLGGRFTQLPHFSQDKDSLFGLAADLSEPGQGGGSAIGIRVIGIVGPEDLLVLWHDLHSLFRQGAILQSGDDFRRGQSEGGSGGGGGGGVQGLVGTADFPLELIFFPIIFPRQAQAGQASGIHSQVFAADICVGTAAESQAFPATGFFLEYFPSGGFFREDGDAVFCGQGEQISFFLGDSLVVMEEFQVRGSDIADQSDLGWCRGGQAGDFPGMIAAHFQYRQAMI